ncbi:oligosaccharide flippase family protein [Segatella copri]|uniref:oligosaccharide flippase family protein n=1 Tax=Segatella copri TaxID=165179 RepID=UPI003F89FB58
MMHTRNPEKSMTLKKVNHCMSSNYNKNRIIKNSLLLYVRMLFTMWLNLWTTRLVLANLGVEDMGVYGVVGSIVNVFQVLTSGIGTAIQRFLTYEMGRKDNNLNGVFCSSVNVIFILAVIMLILLEVAGLWFLNNKVNIPSSSLSAAQWVFQFSVLTCIVNVISIPYNALVIAHEKMNAFAFISILQVVLTCGCAYCLSFLDNRLFYYALFMALIGVIIRIIYQVYCMRNFAETKYHLMIDREQIKQILKFAGVSTTSGILQVISSQGIVFVINWTFGVALNAVYTIALQLKNSVLSFAQNIQKAIAPQITKTYASGEFDAHKKLVYGGSKMEIFMIYFIMLPFLFRTEYIMHLWLGKVPPHTIIFMQSIIFLSLTYAAFEPIRTSVLATNKIAKFLIIPDAVNLISLPLAYFVGNLSGQPSCLIITVVGIEILMCMLRTYYAVKVTELNIKEIFSSVLSPSLYVAIIGAIACYILSSLLTENLMGVFELFVLNSIVLCLIIYFVGTSHKEKELVNHLLKVKINKYK